MKQAKLLVMGEKRLVYEDQVNNAMTAMMESGMAKNDRTLLKAIVEEWSARNLEQPMFKDVPSLSLPEQQPPSTTAWDRAVAFVSGSGSSEEAVKQP